MSVMNTFRQIGGTALCFGLAGLPVAFFQNSHWRAIVPLLFIAVVGLISSRFGTVSGILGGLGSAFFFAYFLFEPLHSLYVADEHQRQNLLLMVAGGMLLAEILGSEQRQTTRKCKTQPARRDSTWNRSAQAQ